MKPRPQPYKVGDEAVIQNRYSGDEVVRVVDVRTFARRTKVTVRAGSHDRDFDSFGHEWKGQPFSTTLLVPMTPEVSEQIVRARLIRGVCARARGDHLARMPTEDLRAVRDLLAKYDRDPPAKVGGE